MPEGRLLLWRRAVFLFHEFRKAHWVGPFHAAGYRWPIEGHPPYIVGRTVLDREGKELTPDMITASPRAWAVLDLTLFPESKAGQMEKYARINPASLANYGLTNPPPGPELYVVRSAPFDDGGVPQIIVGRSLHVEHLEKLQDALVRDSFRATEGRSLESIPDIPIAFLPESKGAELREGMVDIVMQLFSPSRPSMTAASVVELGLDRLRTCISNEAKGTLIRKVEQELRSLASPRDNILSEDIECDGGTYRAKDGFPVHPKRLERIKRKLEAWAAGSPNGRTASLADFGTG